MKAYGELTNPDRDGEGGFLAIRYTPVTSDRLFCFISLVIWPQVLVLELRTRRDAQLYEEYACGRAVSGGRFLFLCACSDEGGSWRSE